MKERKEYSEYLKDMSTAFLSSFLTPAREARIHGFESFIELYIESLDTITKHPNDESSKWLCKKCGR